MGISIGGIVSGLDTDSLINGLVNAASTSKLIMQSHLDDLTSAQNAFAGLSTRLDTLKDAIGAFDTEGELLLRTASTSNAAVATVKADAGAVAGTYTVKVNTLASAATVMSQGYTDRTTGGTLGTGTLAVTYGGTTTNLTLDADSSLDDVAAAINDQVDGVTAYVMDTGDAAAPYRLVISGDDTGATNTVSVDTSGLTSGTPPVMTEVSAAGDAEVEVNGVVIHDSDNDIGGAIAGLTFSAESVSSTAATVTVEADVSGMSDLVQGMVDAYNNVLSYIGQNKVYNPDENIKGPFVGDAMISSLSSSLSAMFSVQSSAGSTLSSLAELGLTTSQDGTLSFDADAFASAYADHPDDVVGILTDGTNGVSQKFTAFIETFTAEDDGRLALRGDTLDTQVTTVNDRITAFDTQMQSYEDRLRRQFTAMEVALGALQSTSSQLTALFATSSSSSS